MMDARLLLEEFASSVVGRLEQAVSADAGNGLVQWAGLHGWDGGIDEGVVARQAALNLVLRALVCYLIRPDLLSEVIPADLVLAESDSLLEELGIAPRPFSYLDDLAVQVEMTVRLSDLEALAAALGDGTEDVLGEVYTRWVPQDARRPLGQFWTPEPIVRLMSMWAIRSPDDRVLDPAFGSGLFLLVALERLDQIGAGPSARQVTGVELSPLVFLIGLVNLLLRYPDTLPTLQWADFLMPEREPAAVLRESAAAYVVGGVRQMLLPGLESVAAATLPGRFDAILCNPPYTRHHRLPDAYKSFWASMVEREYGIRLSRFSGLFAYFFVQAARMLAPMGRMAFITPSVVFEAAYSRQVKAFLARQLRLRAIITFGEDIDVFEGVDTAGCITLAEGPGTAAADTVTLIRVQRWPGVEPLFRVIECGDVVTEDWGSSYRVDLADLDPRRKWTAIGLAHDRFDDERFIPLSEIARVVRGIATGANDFFVLSDEQVAEWGLNWENLRPVLTKTRQVPGYLFTKADFDQLGREGKKRWLLYLTKPVVPGTPEGRYIQYGQECGLHERSLVRTRPFWYAMEQREPAPIYFTYLSRKRSRFIYNQADVLALNVFLCIYPVPAITRDMVTLKALLAVLNSLAGRDSLRHVGRTYGGDTVKVEPRELDRLPVLNPLDLTVAERARLAGLFDRLCRADSQEDEAAICQAIDEAIC